MRCLATAAVVGLGALAFAGVAQACSCARLSPVAALRQADAAIVARLVKVVPRGRMQADYRYRVLHVYSGGHGVERGRTVSVRSARRAAACALPGRVSRRYGLFLTWGTGRWNGGLCGVIAPRKLRLAASHRGRGDGPGTSSASCAA